MKKILIWEAVGALFIIIAGILLHSAYEQSGGLPLLAPFGPVNESVWEHLKIGIWPATFFAVIEYYFIGKKAKNFVAAKVACIYLIPAIILAIYNNYTCVLGYNVLILDILTFIAAVIIGQAISCYILVSPEGDPIWKYLGAITWIVILIGIVWVTYYPPHLPVFRDPMSGVYGIPFRE